MAVCLLSGGMDDNCHPLPDDPDFGDRAYRKKAAALEAFYASIGISG
jgi:hypothetical protein